MKKSFQLCLTFIGITSLYGTGRPLQTMAPKQSALKLRIKVLEVTTEATTPQLGSCIADPIRGKLSFWDAVSWQE